ncbi:unnamed protein product [Ambrosiozyma monospora]|uniref:Unnamed protein product n=1 Tax=Ambrosiozyma monospora TaxID=43982 RepID=A0A9W6T854_AMBMO|nr:unnamed protein product [Ambrosiozyma monospora]
MSLTTTTQLIVLHPHNNTPNSQLNDFIMNHDGGELIRNKYRFPTDQKPQISQCTTFTLYFQHDHHSTTNTSEDNIKPLSKKQYIGSYMLKKERFVTRNVSKDIDMLFE